MNYECYMLSLHARSKTQSPTAYALVFPSPVDSQVVLEKT